MVSKSKKAEQIRDYLVSLTKQVEDAELINSKQVIEIIRMVKVFAVYEHRKTARELNFKNFESTFFKPGHNIYAAFNI